MRQSSWAIHKLQLCGFVGQTLVRVKLRPVRRVAAVPIGTPVLTAVPGQVDE